MLGIAFAASAFGTTTATYILWKDYEFCVRRSSELTGEIHEDDRFARVVAEFSDGGNVLSVKGSVASLADANSLRDKAKNEFWGFKKNVKWRITID